MKISRHLSFLLVFSFFIGSTGFGCFAQTPNQSDIQLDKQMKSFIGRLRIYSKCLRRKGTTEECRAASKAALKDGTRLIVSLGAVAGISYLSYSFLKSITPFLQSIAPSLIPPKNIPQKYEFLAKTVDDIEAGAPLTAQTAKEWVQLFEKIYDYDEYGWIVPEDIGRSPETKTYAGRIWDLGHQIEELKLARKINYADHNARIIIEDIFLRKYFDPSHRPIPPFPKF